MKKKWIDLTKKERNDYINKDYVSLKEITLSDLENITDTSNCDESIWNNFAVRNSAHLKELIIQLHNDGKKSTEISYHLPCSRSYIIKVLKYYLTTKNSCK